MMLFVDFIFVFNTELPRRPDQKQSNLSLRSSLCTWILDFLSNRPQNIQDCNTIVTMTQHTERRSSIWSIGMPTIWNWTQQRQKRWSWTLGDLSKTVPSSLMERRLRGWRASKSTRSIINIFHQAEKVQQRLYFLRKAHQANLTWQRLTNIYQSTTESLLTYWV